ncbi:patatin-like protein 2 [Dorcoceras hygrometricum]|uniref:Patatin-like protein 2 n=1 Tax=Dorcoceras hygrometricum TaxID=472368 RepID=A0A2Z7BHT8_9LAMI|nr:patatin-like protein 2 [Dorcoceras hygrometricum]
MDNEGMVAMCEALITSGLSGVLGCSSAIFKTSLVEFFHNASVRDGVVVSTIQGKPVAISEELFASTFQLPLDGLIDLYEVPQDLVVEAQRAFSYDGKLVSTSCKKKELVFEIRLLNDILAKSMTVKAGSFDVVTHERFLIMTTIYGGVSVNWSKILFKVLKDMRKRTSGRTTPVAMDLTLETVAQAAVPIQMISVVTPPFTAPKQFLKEPLRSGEGEDISGVEQPITAEGPTRIKFGLGIQIPGVSEVDPYTASLSQIAATDKGKENLVEDTIQGHQACQIFSLICADIDFLVQLLTVLGSTEDITAKEKRVLSWADTDSVLIALQRRVLIIAKYRELLLQKFIEARRHNFISETIKLVFSTCWIRAMILVDGSWLIIEGVDYWRSITRPVDSRTWELLPQRPFNDDLAPLCAFIEPVQDLASRSPFSRVVRDLWAEVCIVFVQFSLIGALRPVGTVNYCRDIVGPIVDIEEIPTVFRRVFQCVYCSPSPISTPLISSQGADPTASGVQKDTTLVATEPGVQIQPVSVTTDPTIQIAPVLGSMDQVVQMETNSEPIDRTIQFKANHNPGTPGSGILSPRHTDTIFNSPHTSTSSDSHLRFIADDIPQGDNHILLYAQNLIESFAQLRRSINHIQFEQIRQKDDGEHLKDMILMEIRSLEKKLTEILEQQDSLYRGLFKNVHQEIQIQKTALSLDILIAQRKLSTQHIAVVTGLDDIRKDVKDQKAALSTELEDRLAAVSNDLLDFCVQTQETYNNLSSQLGELVAYINRGVNERKGEGSQQPPTGDRGRSGEDSRSGAIPAGWFLVLSNGFVGGVVLAAVSCRLRIRFLETLVVVIVHRIKHVAYTHVILIQLLQPLFRCCCFVSYQDARERGYHGFSAGRGVDPAGGARGGATVHRTLSSSIADGRQLRLKCEICVARTQFVVIIAQRLEADQEQAHARESAQRQEKLEEVVRSVLNIEEPTDGTGEPQAPNNERQAHDEQIGETQNLLGEQQEQPSSGENPTQLDDPSVNIVDHVNNLGTNPISEESNTDHQGPTPSTLPMVVYTAERKEDTRISFLEDSDSSHTGSQQVFVTSPPASPHTGSRLEEVKNIVASWDSRIRSIDSWMLSMDSKLKSVDSRLGSMDSKIEQLLNLQSFIKQDIGTSRRAFYDKIDTSRRAFNSTGQ